MVLLAGTTACRLWRNRTILVAAMLLSIASCKQGDKIEEKETLPFYNSADFDAEWIDESDPAYQQIHTIDDFVLLNQLGHTITNDSLNGYIYVANFFFTTCSGICPKMTNNLTALQDSFANNPKIKLVSFSVTPWVDTVEQLKQYAEGYGIDAGKWHLLTGSKEDIYNLARTSYFAEKGLGLQKDVDEFLHTESMLLIDSKGRIRGIYNATQKPDILRVIDNITVLLKE